jgi:hypothetical protein
VDGSLPSPANSPLPSKSTKTSAFESGPFTTLPRIFDPLDSSLEVLLQAERTSKPRGEIVNANLFLVGIMVFSALKLNYAS